MSRMYSLFILLMICITANAQVLIKPNQYDFGTVDIAGQLFATYAYKNNGSQPIYLLKIEGSPFISYRKPGKALLGGQSDTLKIIYTPPKEGRFDESIKLYFSDSYEPRIVSLKGTIKKIDNDPTLNCYSFNDEAGINIMMCDLKINVIDSFTQAPIAQAIIQQYYGNRIAFDLHTNQQGYVSYSLKPGLYQYQIAANGYQSRIVQYYINRQTRTITCKLIPLTKNENITTTTSQNPITDTTINPSSSLSSTELPIEQYAFNNIVFLIDVSSSMSLSDRLPLLKQSMQTLIAELRPVDRVSVITYASNAKVIYPSTPITKKDELSALIESLVAGGSTSADKGLQLAHDVVIDNYITDGNNQLIIATDGSFSLTEKDLNLFRDGTANNKPLTVLVIGFGKNKDAQKGLREMARKFQGSYTLIRKDQEESNRALLEEIKKNSRKK